MSELQLSDCVEIIMNTSINFDINDLNTLGSFVSVDDDTASDLYIKYYCYLSESNQDNTEMKVAGQELWEKCIEYQTKRIQPIMITGINLQDPSQRLLLLSRSVLLFFLKDYEGCAFGISSLLGSFTSENACQYESTAWLKKKLSLVYYYLGKYSEANQLRTDDLGFTIWLTGEMGVQTLQITREYLAKQITNREVIYSWDNNDTTVISRGENCVSIKYTGGTCFLTGSGPVIYDSKNIYAGEKSYFNKNAVLPTGNMEYEYIDKALVLPCANAENYFHSLIEFGGRILNWYNSSEYLSIPIDIPIYIPTTKPYILDILRLIIKDDDNLIGRIKLKDPSKYYSVDNLWILDTPDLSNNYQPFSLWDLYMPSPSCLKSLSLAVKSDQVGNGNGNALVYVARRGPGIRNVLNDELLVHFLKEYAVLNGLDYIETEGKESLEVQRYIFSTAKLVIGIHGAGLCNLIFCQKGCKVFEMGLLNHSNRTYERISKVLELDYTVIKDWEVNYMLPIECITEDKIEILRNTL